MTEHLPPGPYDLGPPDEPEIYLVTKWQVIIQEAPVGEDHWQEVDTIQNLYDTEAEADEAGRAKMVEYPDDEDWRYRFVSEEIEVEADPPEPDWDSAPGGHDDI